MLAMASLRLRAYPKETVVAEKLQAMVHLGIVNGRMKDFFDVWFLAQTFSFDGVALAAAIAATFDRRKTSLPEAPPLALTGEFYADDDKKKQWKGFCARSRATEATLETVVTALLAFLGPALAAAGAPSDFRMAWAPPAGPWAKVGV
jgi:hypothetical protein